MSSTTMTIRVSTDLKDRLDRLAADTRRSRSFLAGVGSMLYFTNYASVTPTSGGMPGLKCFVAAVFGGIGSIPGAFLGGLLLGIIEAMAKAYISTNLANSIVFAVLIVVLLVKPAGLLGKSVTEKV